MSDTITATVEEITPEKASFWLQNCNSSNREIKTANVKFLVKELRSGRWKTNGQAIAFSEKGRLLDGQHRLSAIAHAGITVNALIVRGLQEECFDTIDIGIKRNFADMYGVSKRMAALSNFVAREVVSGWTSQKDSYVVYEKFKSEFEEAISLYHKKERLYGSSGALAALAVSLQNQENAEYAKNVFLKLATGDYIDLPPVALSFAAQISSGRVSAATREFQFDLFARLLTVLDRSRKETKLVKVCDFASSRATLRKCFQI